LDNLAETFSAWAATEPSVSALTLFGSRARGQSDGSSDWDFQVITSKPDLFMTSAWTSGLKGARVLVYAPRMTRFGGVPKVNLVFEGAEADLVVLPAGTLTMARLLVAMGFHRRDGGLRRRLRDLAVAIRPGWTFLKGERTWGRFYRRLVDEVDDPRLGDDEIRRLANVFVCDYLWTVRKLERGELVAAQRMLHRELAETLLALSHELRLRRGEPTYPEGRRLEKLLGTAAASQWAVSSRLEAGELSAASARLKDALCAHMASLVADSWAWPSGI